MLHQFTLGTPKQQARESMWVRHQLHPVVVARLPSTRPVNDEIMLTGWPKIPGCFTWVVDCTGEKAICRFFSELTPNDVASAEKAGALSGGFYEDIQLDDNWGFEALKALKDRLIEATVEVHTNLATLAGK